jgi:ubiquitin-protein ligase
MSLVISKETINRLIKDVKQIIKNPLIEQGIYYVHDDSDMMKGYAMIVGPSDTPYFGGFYFFELDYPFNYPHSPPTVKYHTNGKNIRFNPNLYVCGKVCVSLLNTWVGEQWTSCQTISTVLLTLCTLLCKDPLLNEPGITNTHSDFNNYNNIIEYANLDIAVCDIILKKDYIHKPFFEYFNSYIKELFNKNYSLLLKFTEDKINNDNKNYIIFTSLYNMRIAINYHKINDKLKQIKNMFDTS